VEAKIKAQAEARGVSVEALIASIIEGLNGIHNNAVETPDLALAGDAISCAATVAHRDKLLTFCAIPELH
jgi:hypothetical protein